MGHCPQSNHHRSYRHSGSFRSGRLQIAMRTITLLIVHCSATPQGVALALRIAAATTSTTAASATSAIILSDPQRRNTPRTARWKK